MSRSGSTGDGPKPENKSERTSPTYGKKRTTRSELHILMCQAAFEGDWEAAQILVQIDPEVVRQEIAGNGDTALHVAATAKQTKFVRKLVKQMKPEDLLLENEYGYTAFCYAAESGIVKIASVMREKQEILVTTRNKDLYRNPIYIAVSFGHTDMVSYLYQFNPLEGLMTNEERFEFLLALIKKNMYDIALEILTKYESLATMRIGEESPLRLLAQHDISHICNGREASLKRLFQIAARLRLSWLKRIWEQALMRKRAWSLAQKLWDVIQKLEEKDKFDKLITNPPILHDAAEVGNVGFITMLTRSDPDLVIKFDNKGRTMFHIAVIQRQENVFRLFHQIGAMKDWIAMHKCENEGNNILHLAGEIATPDRLKIVAGPALQMQRELMWFKEVEKIVPYSCQNVKNKKGHSPRELFTLSHKGLLEEGEKWMKETANYWMITATLIASVVFAALITVPGGNNNDTGSPILLKRTMFTFFVVSDMAAMFFSTFSIIISLSILTARFQEDDFLVSLPRKLVWGLTGLHCSIGSTMSAFTSTCFLLFTDQSAWIAIFTVVAAFAGLLFILLFDLLHFKLWIDTIRFTCYSSFLFHPSKHSLFGKSRANCRFLQRIVGCRCLTE